MARTLSIALAQCNFWVGDIEGNTELVIKQAHLAREQGADVVVFTELALTGYMAEDLFHREDCLIRVERALERLKQDVHGIGLVVGHPYRDSNAASAADAKLYNSVSFIADGEVLGLYHKQQLPNYHVFDEVRYFATGEQSCVVDYKDHKLGLLICEDLWHPETVAQAKAEGAEIIVGLNASPYHWHKHEARMAVLEQRSREFAGPVIYTNAVNGHDDLVFDGRSMVYNAQGEMTHCLPIYQEALELIQFKDAQAQGRLINEASACKSKEEELYQALVLAVRDYVRRNGFQGAMLGLSGGIDSALTLAVAVDALGADNVQAIMMPFKYTASISIEDAELQAKTLGVEFDNAPIEPMFDAFMQTLTPLFGEDTTVDTTEENLQSRCRGVLLMALSNKKRRIVLTTGNKSEMAVGYATLYGDMCGGFAVLKDVPKIWVYRIAQWLNDQRTAQGLEPVIPQRVIDRPPSAELAPDQVDEDSLPPYEILDAIIEGYIEYDKSVADLVGEGFDEETVRRILRLIDINEYKRRQSAVGPRVTTRSFERNRRFPITNGFGRNRI